MFSLIMLKRRDFEHVSQCSLVSLNFFKNLLIRKKNDIMNVETTCQQRMSMQIPKVILAAHCALKSTP